jgi:HlyD family secretion protein
MKRAALLGAALLLVVAVAAYAYWAHTAERDEGGYVTATVERGPLTETVIATGTVNPVTTVQVGTYVSGPIIALDVDYNSPVHKGQRVAKIDPAPFQVKVQRADANLANARAKVEKSRADLDLKRLTLERNRELRARDFISQNDVDTAKSNYDQAVAQLALDKAGIQQAQADLDEARINLAYTDITSPVDGVVVSRSVDVGQTVAASFQTPTLFQIAQDLTKMQVDTSVSESDIGSVAKGQAATFTVDAYPGRQFTGRVVQVRSAPVTVQNVVTYDVVVAVENQDLSLKPGMTATVTITTAHVDEALRVPLRALTFNPEQGTGETDGDHAHPTPDDGDSVWKLLPTGRIERVAIRTGLRDEIHVAVTGGDLTVGDEVAVALAQSGRKKGMRIPGVPRFH